MYAIVLLNLNVVVEAPYTNRGVHEVSLVKKIYLPGNIFSDFQEELNFLIENEKINLIGQEREFRTTHLLKLKGKISKVQTVSLQMIP